MKFSPAYFILIIIFSFNSFAAPLSDGANGRNITVRADGSFKKYDISGEDGDDGYDGNVGASGKCGGVIMNPDGSTTIENTRGSDGERGHDGDDGGNGGDMTVHYANLSDIKNILLYSAGGHGGKGGKGGSGGFGCPSGWSGADGDDGKNGKKGKLYLVDNKHLPLQQDNSSDYFSIDKLIRGQAIVKQIWSKASGAQTLLSPGSIISDTYHALDGYQHGSATVKIEDETKIDTRLLTRTLLVLLEEGVTKIFIAPHTFYYVSATHSAPSSNAVLTLKRFYSSGEFDGLRFDSIVGNSGSRKILLKTPVDLVPRPELNLSLKVEIKGRFFKYFPVFQGQIAQTLIQKVHSGYLVDLDKLPLSRSILPGNKIRLTMETQLVEEDIVSANNKETLVLKIR